MAGSANKKKASKKAAKAAKAEEGKPATAPTPEAQWGFDAFKVKYGLLGKAEWWWLFDDTLEEIARRLQRDNFVVLDGFLGREKAVGLHGELLRAYLAGRLPGTKHEMTGCPRLELGALAGGKTGKGLTYQMDQVRGDYVAWFSGQETACGWNLLPTYLQRLDTLVAELSEIVPALRGSAAMRSNAMATCYPGGGAHYVRHCDNTSKVQNGRRLTALFYANPKWRKGDGGELRLFRPQNADLEESKRAFHQLADVDPVLDRVVLFFADERVPHEVLPANVQRFAVTVWFFDQEEKERANRRKEDAELHKEEGGRIRREIERFQAAFGAKAKIVSGEGAQGKVEPAAIGVGAIDGTDELDSDDDVCEQAISSSPGPALTPPGGLAPSDVERLLAPSNEAWQSTRGKAPSPRASLGAATRNDSAEAQEPAQEPAQAAQQPVYPPAAAVPGTARADGCPAHTDDTWELD